MKKILLLALLVFTSVASANEVWLFGTKDHKFYNLHKFKNTNHQIKHYLIDGGRDFEQRISEGLSSDPKIAVKQVRARFSKNKTAWDRQAKKSWQGAVNAQSLGITKFPAITFDKGSSVIYGVIDLSKAYKIWENSQ